MNTVPSSASLIALNASTCATPEVDHPPADRLIAGNPQRQTFNRVDVPVAGRLYCGIWRSEPGHWRIQMGPAECEWFTVLAGRCRVHGDDGSTHEAGPGDAIYVPAGFKGSFEVIEAVTKTYAIVDR
ncbi:MAG: DUF861 domain-containing protein [Burkholderiales bacterium]|nr:DUF861 domain-containing protein [Burkholderiales bacterium]MDE2628648.1 DUF861 domain-containing protein [Burkholderiales bacterium]